MQEQLPPQQKDETEEALVKSPQTGGGVINQEKEIAEVSVERTATDIFAPQKILTKEALVKIPYARGSIINQDIAESSTQEWPPQQR